jgi:hypothetical protein
VVVTHDEPCGHLREAHVIPDALSRRGAAYCRVCYDLDWRARHTFRAATSWDDLRRSAA